MGANLKEVRLRIASVKSTTQITKAMKMVSAAKLRRATDRIVQIRPYANQLNAMLQNIAANVGDDMNSSFAVQRPLNKVLIVIITSDKGLCGGFNANSIKLVKALLKEKYADLAAKQKVDILTIGKKGYDAFKSSKIRINNDFGHLFTGLSFENTAKAAEYILYAFEQKEYDAVEVVYNQFKNAAVQRLTEETFLPVKAAADEGKVNTYTVDYIYEPDQEHIVKELIPKSLKIQFYKAVIDSFVAEHGARMTAMHKATDNAANLVRDLTLQYNKARQAAITNQIIEVSSGAEALK